MQINTDTAEIGDGENAKSTQLPLYSATIKVSEKNSSLSKS
jgi:hypothetical protein